MPEFETPIIEVMIIEMEEVMTDSIPVLDDEAGIY